MVAQLLSCQHFVANNLLLSIKHGCVAVEISEFVVVGEYPISPGEQRVFGGHVKFVVAT